MEKGGNLVNHYSDEEQRIAQIYDRYYLDVYRFIMCFTGQKSEAEDLTQETFIQVLKSLPTYNSSYPLKSWVLSIAKHVTIDQHRRRKFYHLFKDSYFQQLISSERSPSQWMEIKTERQMVEKALLKVKPTYRAVFILRAINELSIKETAEVLGYSESKVKVTYLRSIKKLQTLLHIEWEEWKHESTN